MAPDSIKDIAEALSLYIPRFENGKKMNLSIGGMGDYRGLRSDIDNIMFSKTYMDLFITSANAKGLSSNQYERLMQVLEGWNQEDLLQIIGREVYDPWKEKLKGFSLLLNEYNKSIQEAREKEIEDRKILRDEENKRLAKERLAAQKWYAEERLAVFKNEERQIAEAGEKGEDEVNYALKWLDRKYIKVGDGSVRIKNSNFSDESQEIDHIVVGPEGVVLIETKAYSGKIEIDENGNWRREKGSKGWVGEVNPLQQVRRHEKVIKSIVSDDIPIISIVCIANDGAIIDGIENSPLIIVKSDLLVEKIENLTSDRLLSDEEITKVISQISEYILR